MTAYIVLSAIILVLGGVVYFTIKNNIHLKRELKIKEKTNQQILENSENYRKIIVKLNNREDISEEVKNSIDTASGNALANLANSL